MRTPVLTSPARQTVVAGFLYAGLAAVLWSLIAPLSKESLAFGVGPVETGFWRALLGGLCFFAQTVAHGGMRIPWRHAVIFFLFGGWGIGVLFGALQVSIKLSGAAMAMVLLYTAPAWVAVASRFLFHEAISPRKLLALCVALTGTALVCFSGGSLPEAVSVTGIVCGLLSGLAYASHYPFYSWWRHTYSIGTIYTYMLLGGSVFLLPFTGVTFDKPLGAWMNLLGLGVLTNYIAYIAIAKSLQRISQVQSAVIGNIEPILATLLVWLFYGENFTASGWIGGGLVIGAVFLLTAEKSPAPAR